MKLLQHLMIAAVALSTSITHVAQAQPIKDKMTASVNGIVTAQGSQIDVKQAMAKAGLQGLSVAVIEDYKISWVKSWGVADATTGQLVNDQTIYSTASISKAVTGTLVAILQEKGLIDINLPVAQYLKRWQLPNNQYTKQVDITLRHLLSHTAGTTEHGFKDFYPGEAVPSLLDVLAGGPIPRTQKMDVNFMPGNRWRYSGGGYVVAQVAIEDHLGQSLAQLAEQHLFTPLGMTRTTMWQPHQKGFLANAAKAHNRKGEVIGLPICPQLAPSGMWSNPTDMAKLIIEMQLALKGKKTKVISPQVAKLVTTEIKMGVGLGWFVSDPIGNRPSFSHGGSNTGTGGHIYGTFKDGYGIAYFGNGPNGARIPVLNQLKDSIVKAHDWQIERPGEVAMSAHLLANVPGDYRFTLFGPDDVMSIYRQGDQLLTQLGGRVQQLIHLGGGVLLLPDLFGMKLKWLKNPQDNKPYLVHVSGEQHLMSNFDYVKMTESEKTGLQWIELGQYDKALAEFKAMPLNNAADNRARENQLNNLGYAAIEAKNMLKAIAVLDINVTLFPDSANAYDSLGEAYMLNGQNKLAKQYYQQALKLNPDNTHAQKVLKSL